MNEAVKTLSFVAAAAVLAFTAARVQPERRTPSILSDQGEAFYPRFTDAQSVKTIEVVDYDESTAAARPFQVEFRNGRWLLPANHNYVIDVGDRLVNTAGALIDLKKDSVVSDSATDHGRFGVIDPLDARSASLTGRGKRVTLRNARKEVLADFILGKTVEGKTGIRYVRLPNERRVYAVKTTADPSAKFADWVNADLLRIATSGIRRVQIVSYSIDEQFGRLMNMEQTTLTQENGQWKAQGADSFNGAAVQAMAATLDTLKIADVRPKPQSMADGIKSGQLEMTLESAMSMRQKGFFLSPAGRLLANEGEMSVDLNNGVVYSLRFGEVATGEDRYLFVTTSFDPKRAAQHGDTSGAGERIAKDLNNRFADWYYVIKGADFKKLRLKRQDLGLPAQAPPMAPAQGMPRVPPGFPQPPPRPIPPGR